MISDGPSAEICGVFDVLDDCVLLAPAFFQLFQIQTRCTLGFGVPRVHFSLTLFVPRFTTNQSREQYSMPFGQRLFAQKEVRKVFAFYGWVFALCRDKRFTRSIIGREKVRHALSTQPDYVILLATFDQRNDIAPPCFESVALFRAEIVQLVDRHNSAACAANVVEDGLCDADGYP